MALLFGKNQLEDWTGPVAERVEEEEPATEPMFTCFGCNVDHHETDESKAGRANILAQ